MAQVFADYPFARQYFNSLYIAAVVVPLTVMLAAVAGYAFARMRFWGRDAVFLLSLLAMMVPSELTAVPQFVLFSRLGLSNTHLPVILLQLFSATGRVRGLFAAPALHHLAARTGRRGPGRRPGDAGGLLVHHAAALTARAGDGGDFRGAQFLERLLQSADLPQQRNAC